ncbi:translation initiation factor IF-2 N-terminal domain-containing protein [Pseudonocardia hispaniensis]|uniref:Translation initiation factor IF-2 N-terminal domain-containing protein n=1 Tax=Pseudonocardia hispaniensis TaxID=904933 RepID=A0ABW1J7F3_9PSEU
MSNDDAPAGSNGGPSALADLPERVRVHALARLIGRTSREVLAILNEQGIEVRSAQSSVGRSVAEQILAGLRPEEAANVDTPVADATTAAAAEVLEAADATEAAEPAGVPEAGPVGEGAAEAATPGAATAVVETPAAAEPGSGEAPLTPLFAPPAPVFQPPERPTRARREAGPVAPPEPAPVSTVPADEPAAAAETSAVEETDESAEDEGGVRRRRRRGRRGRGRGRGADGAQPGDDETDESAAEVDTEPEEEPAEAEVAADAGADADADADAEGEDAGEDEMGATRRRRRRRRRRASGDENGDLDAVADPPGTVTKIRPARDRSADDDAPDGVQSVRGSTRLEAKRQRRRDGRDAGRRRSPILSEAEFLARRESVERSMVVREQGDRVEIGVLEDGVLVEHFVTGGSSANGTGNSMVGNIYLGRVQNVLPSMEAAFVDIGRGRNAVLYAGEVDWDAAGLNGKARRIEQALTSGDSILVQVTKDPIGHKGARLTTQVSLAGRFLVYVPSGGAAGISRKLPDTERRRLKEMLKEIVPNEAGVIIRTASEGVSQEALERDVRRLQAQWDVIKNKAEATGPNKPKAPSLLYEEPDLLIKVIRDQFNEDFSRLVVSGDDAWDTVSNYIGHVAPELSDRLHRHVGPADVFTEYRIDEQLLKALDRKVWLPSGGTLVIDRTEAMTVIDVNTGKFTGAGGNLEETVTRNNLEAAEEIVRQLRLRDIGGIIVIDFIDMVLEANRDLVLRRLTECLARDRTRHQVAEVTSLGLVQMTRKRVGGGLLEHFSTPCEHCRGRGVIVSTEPVEPRRDREDRRARSRARRADEAVPDERAQQEYRTTGAAAAAAAVAAATTASADRLHVSTPNGHAADSHSAANGTPQETTSAAATAEPEHPAPVTDVPAAPTVPAPRPAATADVTGDATGNAEAAARPRRRGRVTRSAGAPSTGTAATVITAPLPGEVPQAAPVPATIPDQPQPSTAVRPRRARRGASRPAGPPTGIDAGGDPV